jgi:hypothetical protein
VTRRSPRGDGKLRATLSLARHRWSFLLLAGLGSACLEPQVYPCSEHAQCFLRGRDPGRCFAGYCAYPDMGCASGYRYGPSADVVAGECVGGEAETAGGTVADTDPPGSESSGGCDDGCSSPPGACFVSIGICEQGVCTYPPRPAGAPCGGDTDPCFEAGTCDGAGTCSGEPVMCDAPTGPCFEATGSCNPVTGSCTYVPLPEGSACNDGNECTVGDTCNGAGMCIAGPVCPTDNPCEHAACEAGQCVYEALDDGSSCGPRAADRCCAGACVDISSDDDHCGGCFAACVASKSCESISETTMCSTKPAETTGRCTCDANAECPYGQICRNVSPHPWRCAPEGASACHGTFFQMDGCPNYCGY